MEAPKKPDKKLEGIRDWYRRSTKKALRSIYFATAALLIVAVGFWFLAPLSTLMRMQTFNGALTIPLAGGLWIAAFMLVWLIPMREISFRGQESLDRTEERIVRALEDRFNPALDTWKRIGDRVENELLDQMKGAVADMRRVADRLDHAMNGAESRAREIEEKYGPTAERLKTIASHVEEAFQGGVLKEMRDAAQAIRRLNGLEAPRPDPTQALDIIRKRRPPVAQGSNDERSTS